MKHAKIAVAAALIICAITVTSFTTRSDTDSYIIVRTFEGVAGYKSKISISYPDGKTEEIDLESAVPRNMTPNAVKIHQALDKVSAMGYKLLSSNGGDSINMYVFQKK
jgi:hypothetical protein